MRPRDRAYATGRRIAKPGAAWQLDTAVHDGLLVMTQRRNGNIVPAGHLPVDRFTLALLATRDALTIDEDPACTSDLLRQPDFVECVRSLGRLHHLIREQRDESDEGEALREEMDHPGERLSEDESQAVKAISADLGTMDVLPDNGTAATPHSVLKGAADATARGDALRALEILREHAHDAPAAVVACLRGRAFESVGLVEVAEDFFEHARQQTPDNASSGFVWADALTNGDLERVPSASERDRPR